MDGQRRSLLDPDEDLLSLHEVRQRPARQPDGMPEAERLWRDLVTRIVRGDGQAREQFLRTYSPGARVLFRRHLGAIGTSQLAEEALTGAAEEVRRGWIREPRDMVRFLHDVIEREQRRRGQASLAGDRTRRAESGISERTRVREKAARLLAPLRAFGPQERAALEWYYIDEKPEAEILRTFGLSHAGFEELKTRLHESLEGSHRPGRRAKSRGAGA